MSSADFWSTVLCTLRATSSSAVSFLLTALITSEISSATSLDAIGTTFEARMMFSGSSSATMSSVWNAGSAE